MTTPTAPNHPNLSPRPSHRVATGIVLAVLAAAVLAGLPALTGSDSSRPLTGAAAKNPHLYADVRNFAMDIEMSIADRYLEPVGYDEITKGMTAYDTNATINDITLTSADHDSYCIDGTSFDDGTRFFYDSNVGKVREGACT